MWISIPFAVGQGPSSSHPGQGAATLILVGMILQAIQVAVLFGLGLFFVSVPVLGQIALVLGGIGLVWLVLVYVFSYLPTAKHNYSAARTPTLVFAILSILTIGLLSGFLYIVAFSELGDPRTKGYRTEPWRAPTPIRAESKICPICGRSNPLSSLFCQTCGIRLG